MLQLSLSMVVPNSRDRQGNVWLPKMHLHIINASKD